MMELNGTTYHEHTDPKVAAIIEDARIHGRRIRLFYGDTETGRDWMEEHDVMGTIGRSMGPVKIPILMCNKRSMCGPGILDHCIVKIVDLRSGRKETGGYVVWQHPKYKVPNLEMISHTDPNVPKYHYSVLRDGETVARFKKQKQAIRYMEFMRGDRNAK